MPRYSIPVWQMCVKALRTLDGEISFVPLINIVKKVQDLYPSENVHEGTIRDQIFRHCVNCHPSHDSYPDKGKFWRKRKLFVTDGRGNYRFYSGKTDRALYIRALEEDGFDSTEYTAHAPGPSDEPLSPEEAEALAFIYIAQNIRPEGVLQADSDQYKYDGTLKRLLERELIKDTAGLGHKLYLTTTKGIKKAKGIIQRRLDENRYELTQFLDSIPPKLCQFLLQEIFVEKRDYSAIPRAHSVVVIPSSGSDDTNTNRHECLLVDKRVDIWRRKILKTLKKLRLAEFVRSYVSTRGGEVRDYEYCIPEDVIEFFETYLANKELQIVFTSKLERDHRIYHFLYQLARSTYVLNDEEELYSFLVEHNMDSQEFQQIVSDLLEENLLRRDEEGLHTVNFTDEAIRKKYLYPIVRELILKPMEASPDVVSNDIEITQIEPSLLKTQENKLLLVVVSDCKQKIWDRNPAAGPTKAREAFVGAFYKTNREYAEKFGDAWVILSTKDGFLVPDFTIPQNYDVYPSTITVHELLKQAAEMNLANFKRVEILAGPWDEHKTKARECFERLEIWVHEPYATLNDAREMIKTARRAIETNRPFTKLEEELKPLKKEKELAAGKVVIESGEHITVSGDQYRFSVKITNNSPYIISHVTVLITSYPHSLNLLSNDVIRIPTIGPNGQFVAPKFSFEPQDSCLKGVIEATITYYDHLSQKQPSKDISREIRAICGLLEPYEVEELFTYEWASADDELLYNLGAKETFNLAREVLTRNFQIQYKNLVENGRQVRGTIQASARGKYGHKRLIFRFTIQGDSQAPNCWIKQDVWAEDADMRAPVLHELKMELQEYVDNAIRALKVQLGKFTKKLPIPTEIHVDDRLRLFRTIELHFVCPIQHTGCLAPREAPIVVKSKEWSRWVKLAILTVKVGVSVVQGRIGELPRDMKDIWTTLRTETELYYEAVERNPLITANDEDLLREELQKADFLKQMTYCPQCFRWVCHICFDFLSQCCRDCQPFQ